MYILFLALYQLRSGICFSYTNKWMNEWVYIIDQRRLLFWRSLHKSDNTAVLRNFGVLESKSGSLLLLQNMVLSTTRQTSKLSFGAVLVLLYFSSSSSSSRFISKKQTVTAISNHNQAVRKSRDQQSWLPMITTQIWYNYAVNKTKQNKN